MSFIDILVAALVLVTLSNACTFPKPESSSVPRTQQTSYPVPLEAPDTIPSWFSHDSSYTAQEPRYLKHVIGIAFHQGTSQVARQAVVDSVAGNVVGGWRLSPVREGLHAVHVADTMSDGRLHQLIDRLRTLPQVKLAVPVLFGRVN